MYPYRTRRAAGISAIFFIVLFLIVIIGTGWLLLTDKGKFWDLLPFICIPSVIINLVLFIFYFAKRNIAGYIFTLFFLIFLTGVLLSSFCGPFRLYKDAVDAYENKQYGVSAEKFASVVKNYPTSKYSADSTKNLVYSYYLDSRYQEAIEYFNLSIEKELVESENLEIKKILSESYYKLGEIHYSGKQYELAAQNFLASVDYFKEISAKFPDTNEAFVAKYKVPELLYKAAESHKNTKQWDDAIEILDELKAIYPDSEYYKSAENLLYYIYIMKSGELKADGRSGESIEVLVKVLELDSESLNYNKYQVKSRLFSLLQGIRETVIIETADRLFLQGKNSQALFIYGYVYEKYPDFRQTIIMNYIDCNIRIALAESNTSLETLLQTEPTGFIGKEGFAKVSFENKTGFQIIIFIKGPEYEILELDNELKTELDLTAGNYSILVLPSEEGARPFYGELLYEDGARYREVFNSDSDVNN